MKVYDGYGRLRYTFADDRYAQTFRRLGYRVETGA